MPILPNCIRTPMKAPYLLSVGVIYNSLNNVCMTLPTKNLQEKIFYFTRYEIHDRDWHHRGRVSLLLPGRCGCIVHPLYFVSSLPIRLQVLLLLTANLERCGQSIPFRILDRKTIPQLSFRAIKGTAQW